MSEQERFKSALEQADAINAFHTVLLTGSESSPALKAQIESVLEKTKTGFTDTEEKAKKINDYFSELFTSTETRKSVVEDIGTYYKRLLVDPEGGQSLKTELENLLKDAKKEYSDFSEMQADLRDFQKKMIVGDSEEESVSHRIDKLYSKLFITSEEGKSLESQFDDLLSRLNSRISEADKKIKNIENLHDRVFDEIKDEKGEVLKPSLINTIELQRRKLDTLIIEANHKLYALTDSSLHNAFATRAEDYTREFKRLEKITFNMTLGIIADILIFGIIQLILVLTDKPFNYHLLIYQFSIAGALVFAIWMYNRNQKIAKKLAEEYHHKAAIAEAMTGYRQLYGLEHTSPEYMELFNSLKKQLNTNPSTAIDKFLNLKSPQEDLTGVLKDTLSPEKLKDFAELLKPHLS